MLMSVFYYFMVVLGALVSVAFFTLYERKVMSLVHYRKGPNVVSYFGLLQPMSDAVKLLMKNPLSPNPMNNPLYVMSPGLLLLVGLLSYVVIPYSAHLHNYGVVVLVFFVLLAASVYFHLAVGWSSNSNFSVLGSMRCVAQSVSYEVGMAFLFLSVVFLYRTLFLSVVSSHQESLMALWLIPHIVLMWFISLLAETNRAPFDFAEGESELVSGFNVELGSVLFTTLFLYEYASILFMCLLISCLYFKGMSLPAVIWIVGVLIYLVLWVRTSYPRTRYDKLMSLSWLIVLPMGLLTSGVLIWVVL